MNKTIDKMTPAEKAQFFADMDFAGFLIDIKDDIEALLPAINSALESWNSDKQNVHINDTNIFALLSHMIYKTAIYIPEAVEDGMNMEDEHFQGLAKNIANNVGLVVND